MFVHANQVGPYKVGPSLSELSQILALGGSAREPTTEVVEPGQVACCALCSYHHHRPSQQRDDLNPAPGSNTGVHAASESYLHVIRRQRLLVCVARSSMAWHGARFIMGENCRDQLLASPTPAAHLRSLRSSDQEDELATPATSWIPDRQVYLKLCRNRQRACSCTR